MKHELTSHVAFESVFKFFDERLRASADECDTSEADQADTPKDQADTPKDQADTSTSVTETTEIKDGASSSQDIKGMDSSQSPQSQEDGSQMETDNTT